ncbi:DUF952 domain-containing protein [Waterburya agarophytonicola]|uniref:DUF952 domain-containing protein n=1 Tax=Waterburya agarophytonicola TaxID=2886916 RepID=UPI001E4A2D66
MANNKFLYHITSADEWDAAQLDGEYTPQGFAEEGFIHCSYSHQLITVAHRFYKGQNGLVILAIEPSTISSSLVEENLEGGAELYPHVYRPLPINSVVKAVTFPCNVDGSFTLPEELNA